MEIKLLGQNLTFDVYGSGPALIFLHGWGQNKETFRNLVSHFEEDHTLYILDLPGFGKSELLSPWNLGDYVKVLHAFIEYNNLENVILLGHSFGGRIAIKYAKTYPIEKLILVDSAGLKKRLSIWKKTKVIFYKTCKKLGIKLNMGSKDYKNASPILKQTMSKILSEDLSADLGDINCPTALIWGEYDKDTPVSDAKKMNKLIRNSGLIIIPKCGHFPYLERSKYFILVLSAFLRGSSAS